MLLSAGARLGVYEILSPLGTGGMGIVYRAWDTRLRREVALKLLQPEPEGAGHEDSAKTRLLHEARAAAPLNHPHICTIYEVGDVDGAAYIAMEFVAGETLHAVIARGPLAVDRACRLGRQLADALEHAHTLGVIHRDFKSANVIVTPDGRAKVLDFGIARRTQSSPHEATHTHALTESPGTVSGTLAYLAPELLRGEPAGVRSEIWALGVVLYEMVCGQPPFHARTASEMSAAILRDRPKPPPLGIPIGLLRVIDRCLAKEPAERFGRAGEIAAALEIVETTATSGDVERRSQSDGSQVTNRKTVNIAAAIHRPRLAIAIVTIAAAAGVLTWVLRDTGPTSAVVPPTREAPLQLTQFSTSAREPVISPDGRLVAFVVQEPRSLTSQIFIKALPDGRPTQLTRGPGTKSMPAFSLDGRRIAYTVSAQEWKWDTWVVEVTGGTPQLMLANANSLRWLKDGRVLFSEFKTGAQLGIAVADEGRGSQRDVYVPQGQGMAHYSDLSPDRNQVVVGEMFASQTTQGATVRTRCFVMPMTGGAERTVSSGSTPCIQLARWAPDGRFVYFVAGEPGAYHVWRQPAGGGPAEQLTSGPSMFLRGVIPGGFALSPDGTTLVYSVGETQEAVWLRRGDGSETQLTFEGDARTPSVSDDGRVLFYIAGPRFRAGPIRMRRIDSDEDRAVASGRLALAVQSAPDGEHFVFSSRDDDGHVHLWLGTTDNSAAPRQITLGDSSEVAAVFGRNVTTLYYVQNSASDSVLWSLDLPSGERKQISEPAGRLVPVSVSPDGEWLSVLRTDLTPRETWLYPTTGGERPRPLYKSWRFEWAPGNRAFLISNSGMVSSAWSIPNPHGALFPPNFEGDPTPEKLQRVGARKVLVSDFFVDPVPLSEPFSIVYSHVEGRSNLFRIRVPD